jgi:hypothetical protein
MSLRHLVLTGVGVNEEDQEEEEERHIPDVASEAADGQQHEKEAEEDEQEAATANHLTEDGDDNSSLADVSRDTKRTVTFDVPDSPPASPLSSAPGDDHEAAASSGGCLCRNVHGITLLCKSIRIREWC